MLADLVLSVLYLRRCVKRWQLEYALALFGKTAGFRLDYDVGPDGVSVSGLDGVLESLEERDVVSAGNTVCLENDEFAERSYDRLCDEYDCSKLRKAVKIATSLSKEQVATYACFAYGLCDRALSSRLQQYRVDTAVALVRNRLATCVDAAKVSGYGLRDFMNVLKSMGIRDRPF